MHFAPVCRLTTPPTPYGIPEIPLKDASDMMRTDRRGGSFFSFFNLQLLSVPLLLQLEAFSRVIALLETDEYLGERYRRKARWVSKVRPDAADFRPEPVVTPRNDDRPVGSRADR